MKLGRRILFIGCAAGVIVVGSTLGGGTKGTMLSESGHRRIVSSVAAGPTKGQSVEATPLKSTDLHDVRVPDNINGFEKLIGSSERGTNLLKQRLSCLHCHSIEPGEDAGFPNLSDVATRLSPKEIVTSILEPSRDFAKGYKSIQVVTLDGEVVQGVELNSNEQAVVLRTSRGEEIIRRDEIEEMRVAKSDMPDGIVDDLNSQEFADLIAALLTLENGGLRN